MTSPASDTVIVIRGRGRVSALGLGPDSGDVVSYATSPFTTHPATGLPVAALPPAAEAALAALRLSHPAYRQLDRTVLLALLAVDQLKIKKEELKSAPADGAAVRQLLSATPTPQHPNVPAGGLKPTPHPDNQQQATENKQQATEIAVSIGSSRGATHLLEEYHAGFLAERRVPAAASPLTTLGNVASWVAFAVGQPGSAALSHSSTCSSAFQALGNAVAWLRAGLADRFLAGGAEAPLTEFTLAQMRAIGIYSPYPAAEWPCRPGAGRPATFGLGEGAAVFGLERGSRTALAAAGETAFVLESVGFGFEAIASKTGLSADGQHFQQAMRAALRQAGHEASAVDAVVLHSPGTPAGDAAERAALRAVLGETLPPLLSNKWRIGHTLGASGALSLDFALDVLATQQWPAPPFATDLAAAPDRPIRRILVNAAGFGGNAASALVSVG